ncbi:FAD-dependent monooxygenase [Amycolatopsis sp. H20-H5]|uniref:FAD-dependent monooxygenase n=1 Tax=Amycolatopsis sp. H20-H5 TaxID=3046309 RepID=UPI002DBE4627|nr:FAD-dependent monooxygenase [Amycolatopsis sp. H20-H5]MEC3976281.1 FAD-dependent monooxygenase [Amycolatopsis sp. H20-H5]
MDKDYEVIVSGGGPTGLMLACELVLWDVSVLVVERLAEPDLTIKAGAITLHASEALYRRGYGDQLAEVQYKALARFMPGFKAPVRRENAGGTLPKLPTHFGGLFKIDATRLDGDDEQFQVHADAVTSVVSQQELERVLGEGAAKLGVEVLRAVELTGFTQDDDGVSVRLSDGRSLRAAFLAGCDGGRSTVRKLAGFGFPGTEPTITGHQAMVELDDPGKLPRGWNRTDVGMLVAGPSPERVLTVEFDGPPADRDAPVTAEEIQASLRHVSGTDVTVLKVRTATRFTDNARQASTYRQGRVLLAGDAAHVHSPFGGQGLTLGIGDAVNLGWKLAATLRGWAPDGLLDTYTRERHPIAAKVLEATRAQVALMRPDPMTSALRDVVSDLMDTEEGNAYFAKLMSGLGQRYDLGDGDPLVGGRTPDIELADGSWIGDHFADGQAVLFDFAGSPEVAAAVSGHAGRITLLSLPPKQNRDITALLVRPDGYVAWASRTSGAVDGLAEAIGTWFGKAVAAAR